MRNGMLLTAIICLGFGAVASADQGLSRAYFVASDGVKIHYMVQGSGTPVVLIHGYTGTAEGNWFINGIAGTLSKTNRVIALDVRGHGQSDKPHDAAMYGKRIWQDVLELMDHLAINKCHVHGYSMGGAITTQLLIHAPGRFITASYGGSGVRETDAEWQARIPPDREGMDPEEAEARNTLSSNPARDEEALGKVRETWREAFAEVIDLTKITIPVLAINGELDSPNAKTHRMKRQLKNFKSVVLSGKSHLTAIMAGYMPEEYLATLTEFITANNP